MKMAISLTVAERERRMLRVYGRHRGFKHDHLTLSFAIRCCSKYAGAFLYVKELKGDDWPLAPGGKRISASFSLSTEDIEALERFAERVQVKNISRAASLLIQILAWTYGNELALHSHHMGGKVKLDGGVPDRLLE